MASLPEMFAAIEHVPADILQDAYGILDAEGGFDNNPNDNGGATNYGISLLFARSQTYIDENGVEQKTFDLNHDGRVDTSDIQEITPQIAVGVYLLDFFLQPGLGNLASTLQAPAFDTSVNGGPNKAVRLVQSTVNVLRQTVPAVLAAVPVMLKQDGILGAKTNIAARAAAENCTTAQLVNTFCDRRVADYEAIVRGDPRDQEFLENWLSRANKFRITGD